MASLKSSWKIENNECSQSRPFANAVPALLEFGEVAAWVGLGLDGGGGAQGFVGPGVEAVLQAEFVGDLAHGAEGGEGVALPALAVGEDFGAQGDAELGGVAGDALYVLRADVDGLVEDRNGVERAQGGQGVVEIGGVALGVGGGHGGIDMQSGLAGGLQGGEALGRCGGAGFVDFAEVIAQGGQAHAEEQSGAEAAEQIEVLSGERAAGEDADEQGGVVADQLQGAPHQMPGGGGEFPLTGGIGMANGLVGIGGGTVDDGAIAVGFQLMLRGLFGCPERGEEAFFIPATEQHVVAPFGIRIGDAVLFEQRSHFDGGGAGHVTEAAGVRAADGDVEGPVRQAFVDEVVGLNGGRHVPEIHGLPVQNGSRGCGGAAGKFEEVGGDHAGNGLRLQDVFGDFERGGVLGRETKQIKNGAGVILQCERYLGHTREHGFEAFDKEFANGGDGGGFLQRGDAEHVCLIGLVELGIPFRLGHSQDGVQAARPSLRDVAVTGQHAIHTNASREQEPHVDGPRASDRFDGGPIHLHSEWVEKQHGATFAPIPGLAELLNAAVGIFGMNGDPI